MFERYLADALATHCGHFIDDFDADKVKVSVWNGEVVLKDLRLKRNALQHLLKPKGKSLSSSSSSSDSGDRSKMEEEDDVDSRLPFQIVHGEIGTFELRIPWGLFQSSQQNKEESQSKWSSIWAKNKAEKAVTKEKKEGRCSIHLSDIDILIVPGKPPQEELSKSQQQTKTSDENSNNSSNKEVDADNQKLNIQNERIEKENQVQNLLDALLLKDKINLISTGNGSKEEKKSGWIENLLKNVFSSLSITIQNVHVRYEDPGDRIGFDVDHHSAKGATTTVQHRPPFALGITLAEFCVMDTDQGPLADSEYFTIQNMDGPQDQTLISRNDSTQEYALDHKLISTEDLAIYWDSHAAPFLIHSYILKRRRRRKRSLRKLRTDSQEGLLSFDNSSFEDFNNSPNATRNNKIQLEQSQSFDFQNGSREDILRYRSMMKDAFHSAGHGHDNINRKSHTSVEHSYIIYPISPSLHVSSSNANGDDSTGHLGTTLLPPTRAVLSLPPIQVNVTRDILEDVAYIRRSVAVWKEEKNNILSRNICAKLSRARPASSPLQNPRAWWKYAVKAIHILSNRKTEKHSNGEKSGPTMIKLLEVRKEYLRLYRMLLFSRLQEKERKLVNDKLTLLEDILESHQIAAFRLFLVRRYFTQRNEEHVVQSYEDDSEMTPNLHGRLSLRFSNNDERRVEAQHIHCSNEKDLSDKYRAFVIRELIGVLEKASNSDSGKRNDFFLQKVDFASASKFELSIICPQMTLQIDDVIVRNKYGKSHFSRKENFDHQKKPIIRISSASVHKFCLRHNALWDINCTLASLEILNLMENTIEHSESHPLSRCHPRLLTRKKRGLSDREEEKSIIINGVTHFHSATVLVKKIMKSPSGSEASSDPITSVKIKLSPMEVISSSDTIQALSQIISRAKTAELASDYQRLSYVISNWKTEQKRRLLEVLAKKEKTLILNIDVSAPVLLVEDDTSKGVLVLDLGRLTFVNSDELCDDYDDAWNLSMKDIQVFSSTKDELIGMDRLGYNPEACHLVEPFSLEFVLRTNIGTKAWDDETGSLMNTSKAFIEATLPRLVFNMKSSAVRLVHRIMKFREIKNQQTLPNSKDLDKVETKNIHSNTNIHTETENVPETKKNAVQFIFSAPFIVLRLANDIDGRDSVSNHHNRKGSTDTGITPIVELNIQGIGGEFSYTSIQGCKSNVHFSSSIKTMYAKDLYQQAGHNFSMLLSSENPDYIEGDVYQSPLSSWSTNAGLSHEVHSFDDPLQSDLFCIEYECHQNEKTTDFEVRHLSIKCHELYSEWNPETIAAIQKAMRLSSEEKFFFNQLEKNDEMKRNDQSPSRLSKTRSISFDDSMLTFFDAVEDVYESQSSSASDYFLSEISSCDDEYEHASNSYQSHSMSSIHSSLAVSPLILNTIVATSLEEKSGSTMNCSIKNDSSNETQASMIKVTFQLSKLRINFNKESRYRRLITAEMSRTRVEYKSKPSGGSKTNASIGNLTFMDPVCKHGSSLYREILGLNTDSRQKASLLEITHESFPRAPNIHSKISDDDFSSHEFSNWRKNLKSVEIDSESRYIYGCDTAISLQFSPMRFVVLEQLWLEISDYFFEGIMGYEVWGKDRPDIKDTNDNNQTSRESEKELNLHLSDDKSDIAGSDGGDISFLKFIIVMDSPTILLPVQYRSPQHLRFDFAKVQMKNYFKGQVESSPNDGIYLQWYNNCDVNFSGLKLSTWCGRQLNRNEDPKLSDKKIDDSRLGISVAVKWPKGATARNVLPKWDVVCQFDAVR